MYSEEIHDRAGKPQRTMKEQIYRQQTNGNQIVNCNIRFYDAFSKKITIFNFIFYFEQRFLYSFGIDVPAIDLIAGFF